MAKVIAAGIFIVRKDGSLLVCHPTNHDPNLWSIPKGKVEVGEMVHAAAVRETFEETNIDFNQIGASNYSIHRLELVVYKHKKKVLCPFVYMERPDSKIDWSKFDIKCNSFVPVERGGFPEMDDYRWVSTKEARGMLHETQVACLDIVDEIIKTNSITMMGKNWQNDGIR